jgi:HYR domain
MKSLYTKPNVPIRNYARPSCLRASDFLRTCIPALLMLGALLSGHDLRAQCDISITAPAAGTVFCTGVSSVDSRINGTDPAGTLQTYTWEYNPNGTGWVTAPAPSNTQNYLPPFSITGFAGTYAFRRVITGSNNVPSCNGTSNEVTLTIVSDPTSVSIAVDKNPVCKDYAFTFTPTFTSITGITPTYDWERAQTNLSFLYSNAPGTQNGLTYTGTASDVTPDYYYQLKLDYASNTGCGDLTSNAILLLVEPQPIAPLIDKSPLVPSVCPGTILSVYINTPGSLGAGACADEYRYSTDGGTTWTAWSTTVPSFAAVGDPVTGLPLINLIQSRRNCDGGGCVSNVNEVSWKVEEVAPVFQNCPSDLTVNNDVDKCSAVVFWTDPTATDDCGVPTVTRTSAFGPGSVFTIAGSPHTVIYKAIDGSNNEATCSFKITVRDMQKPNAVCKDATIALDGNGEATVSVTDVNGGSTDNCGVANVTISALGLYECQHVGTNNVLLTVTDNSGNTATCYATVTIVDDKKPHFTCPTNTVKVTSCQSTVPNLIPLIGTPQENCGMAPVLQTPPAGTDFAQYNGNDITVTITVPDINGNYGVCDIVVKVDDSTAPTLYCPTDITVNNDPDKCGANVNWNPPVFVDDCRTLPTLTRTTGPAPGTYFEVGNPILIVYTATDANSNTATCYFTVKVNDMQRPKITCPTGIQTLYTNNGLCSHTVSGTKLDATATDNCTVSEVLNDFTDPYSNTLNGAVFPLGITMVQWIAKDIFLNTATCMSTILVLDDDAPSLTCPADLTASCSATEQVPYATYAAFEAAGGSATDNCEVDKTSFTLLGETSNGETCPQTITRTYRVTDVNGNTNTCAQKVVVHDKVKPEITAPANLTLSCVSNQQNNQILIKNWLGGYTATDNCDDQLQVKHTFNNPILIDYCTGDDITVTWTATDDCGNSSSTSAVIVVNKDETAPTITAPANLRLTCVGDQQDNQAAITDWLDNYTISDGCDNDVDVKYDFDRTLINYCVGRDLVVTWTATDDCGNSSTTSAIIVIVRDETAPLIIAPANLTLSCVQDQQDNQAAITDWLDNYVAGDRCDSDVKVTHSFNNTTIDYCTGADIIVTWTATDDCGNTSRTSATIVVNQDVTPPAITAPADLTLSCVKNQQDNQAAITDWLDNYTVSDGCDSEVTVKHSFNNTTIDYCTGADLVVTWTATDDCGNTSQTSATIVVVQDGTAPTITAPANLTLFCVPDQQDNQAAITDWLDNYTVSDGCDSDVKVTYDFDRTLINYCVGRDLVVTWTATDDCGNTSSTSATIVIVRDQTPPTITAPSNLFLFCVQDQQDNQAAITDWLDNFTVSDRCDSDVNVTHDFDRTTINYCTGVDLVVTWTATDDCGNSSQTTATIVVARDQTPPLIIAPANLTLSCVQDQQDNQAAITDWLDNYVVGDGCDSEVTVTHTFVGTTIDYCTGNDLTIFWTARDDCGNTSRTSAVIVVVKDETAPTITAPANLTLSCVQDQQDNQAAITDWLDKYAVKDNCDSEVTVTDNFSATTIDYCTGDDITVTWTATDDCGNSSSTAAVIVVIKDETAPVIKAPANLTMSCVQDQQDNQAAITDWLDKYSVSDGCDSEVTVTDNFSATTIDYCTGDDITVTWTATDDCGNSSSTSAVIIVVKDETAPTITAPVNLTLSCVPDQQDNQAAVTDWLDNYIVSDGCDSEVTVTHNFSATTIDYCTGADITVTWTATDDCGNSSSTSAVIVVDQDLTPPAFDNCPGDITLNNDVDKCGAAATWPIPSARDLCNKVAVTQTSGPAQGEFLNVGTVYTVVYTATDACGNTATCAFDITVRDMQRPTPVCKDATVYLDEEGEAGITPETVDGGSFDNCAIDDVSINISEFDCDDIGDNYVILTVTDESGNSATCYSTVTVLDTIPPTVVCPIVPTYVNSCLDTIPNLIGLIGTPTDNCDIASIKQNPPAGVDFASVNGGQTTVTITVTDESGNETDCKILLVVDDSAKPLLFCPANIVVNNDPDKCGANVNWNPPVYLDDCLPNAKIAQTKGLPSYFPGAYFPVNTGVVNMTPPVPDAPVLIEYTATDANGNTQTCSFTVSVRDMQIPTLRENIVMPGDTTVDCDRITAQYVYKGPNFLPLLPADIKDNCPLTGAKTILVFREDTSSYSYDPRDCDHYDYVLTRVWTWYDKSNNRDSFVQVVTVIDTIKPVAKCKAVSVILDKFGKARVPAKAFDNESTDRCAENKYLTFKASEDGLNPPVDTLTVDCADLGENVVTLTVIDPCGNSSTCTAILTVSEGIAPCTPIVSTNHGCLNNATTLDNGQFQDTITIKSLAMQNWVVKTNSGFFSVSSAAPPAAGSPIALNTPFVSGTSDGIDNDKDGVKDEADEMIWYTLIGRFTECVGYSLTATNAAPGNRGMAPADQTVTISNKACYPTPIFTNLVGPYCLSTPPFVVDVVDKNGAVGTVVSITVQKNGVGDPIDITPPKKFDIGSLGIGKHKVKATFDAGDAKKQLIVNGVGQPVASDLDLLKDPGCQQMIMQEAEVVGTPDEIVCDDLIQVSLDEDCKVTIFPDQVMEGEYLCYDDYSVHIAYPAGTTKFNPANMLDGTHIGKTLKFTLKHILSGNVCWGEVLVEDKLPPKIVCKDIWLTCADTINKPEYLKNILGIVDAYPQVTNNCGTATLSYIDTWFDADCSAKIGDIEISAYIKREWTATDQAGKTSTCTQTLYFERIHAEDVIFPAKKKVECTYPAAEGTSPSVTGAPYIVNKQGFKVSLTPNKTYCELVVKYADDVYDVCDGTRDIIRRWSVLDRCRPASDSPTNPNPRVALQEINVFDESGPVFVNLPKDLTVNTNADKCCASGDLLPSIIVDDNCSRVDTVRALITFKFLNDKGELMSRVIEIGADLKDFDHNNKWDRDTLADFLPTTECLPVGTHEVTVMAKDQCGNVRTAKFNLTIEDQNVPFPVCDELTQVSLGGDGSILVKAKDLDRGSYDNCGEVFFKVKRMTSDPKCLTNGEANADGSLKTPDSFSDVVKFCCSDANDTVNVILRMYDRKPDEGTVSDAHLTGRHNECMIRVLVDDKLPPICEAPKDVTVYCDNFDPSLWPYGVAKATDNCENPTLTLAVSKTNFDSLCKRGTIVRTWTAKDLAGRTSRCTQRIFVNYREMYTIRFPADIVTTTCDKGGYTEPTFTGEDCELLAKSHEDDTFFVVEGACYKVERVWRVINWCTYDPNAGYEDVMENPLGARVEVNLLEDNKVKTFHGKDGNTLVMTWVYDDDGNRDPKDGGDVYGSGYEYKQIIKVLDNVKPILTCIAPDPCDESGNNPLLWNGEYTGKHDAAAKDLCEGRKEVCVKGSDACSDVLRYSYQLFLDLDGDGEMETVINSNTPPPAGTVDAAGKVFFDNRPIGGAGNPIRTQADLYRWTLTLRGDSAACVTWTDRNGTVNAEYPYGKHKIKWFLEDRCGNTTTCEYVFEVKDCKKPIVVCKNVNVNIMKVGPNGMVTLWASDFYEYGEDNCTPANQLKFAVTRENAQKPDDFSKSQDITFDCADVKAGTTVVWIWVQDGSGNADYCANYVKVQDNLAGACGDGTNASIAGALKTEKSAGVEDANVEFEGSHPALPPLSMFRTTNEAGEYRFSSVIPLAGNYTVTPLKDDNPINGVNAYDLVLISKHILGIEPINTPYKMVAADANKTGSITASDIVELRKLILGIYKELPNNTSWRFVDKSYVFPDPANPFAQVFPENKTVAQVQANQLANDFVGVKIGDLDGTVIANSLTAVEDRSAGTLFFDVADRTVAAGEEVVVNFKAADKTQGYQFTMDLNGLEVKELLPGAGMTENNFAVFAAEKALTAAVESGAGEFAIRFRAIRAGTLSDMLKASGAITAAKAYDAAGEPYEIAFRFNDKNGVVSAGSAFELLQNTPNPVKTTTIIGFNLPEAGNAILRITNAEGRLIKQIDGTFGKGLNQVSVNRGELPTGVLFYELRSGKHTATKKMIIME